AGGSPVSVAVVDFNGDGTLDLATANVAGVSVLLGNVSVLQGKGDGTLAVEPTFGVAGSFPASVAVGDFNGDGKLDLATANINGVSVLLANGDASFPVPLSCAAGGFPVSVAVGDFNGDGKLDLAVANHSSNDVSVLLGNGDGTF